MLIRLLNLIGRLMQGFNYNERRRQIDERILWPELRRQAKTIEEAQGAFYLHAMSDPAWTALGEERMLIRIGKLK